MSDLYWLTDEQMARFAPYFPKSHGKARVDDRRVRSFNDIGFDPDCDRSSDPLPNYEQVLADRSRLSAYNRGKNEPLLIHGAYSSQGDDPHSVKSPLIHRVTVKLMLYITIVHVG